MLKNLKNYIIIVAVLVLGAIIINKLLKNYIKLEEQKIESQLQKAHTDAIINAKAGIQVYATLVSSLKSYTKNSEKFPSEKQLQQYLKDLLKEIQFSDSTLINYINKNHVFKYVITPNEIDPAGLKGISVKNIRPKTIIDELDSLMKSDSITLFKPVNLREGWTGFPFNFSARNSQGEILGYFTPIINVKYLLGFFYKNNSTKEYVHRFMINDSIDLTREGYYDGSKIYSKATDLEYYKNFNVNTSDFVYSTIELFGLKLKIGSAYKKRPKIDDTIADTATIWYALVCILSLLALYQYLKNKLLNNNLKIANNEVLSKNKDLEISLFKIQTLIKEIHHRIKNNMLMISSVLSFQEDEYDDENVKAALRESQNRIHSMALLHEKLYNARSLKEIKIKDYITQLIQSVEDTVRRESLSLSINTTIDDSLEFDQETSANLGIIINELLTNSFKYAFKESRENVLNIELLKQNNSYILTYKDSGPGLPEDFDLSTTASLGIQLINILSEQMNGSFDYQKNPKNMFIITFNSII